MTTTTTLRPTSDHLVVRRDDAANETPGGIVLATGPGQRMTDGSRAPMEVNEGDRIVFSAYAGSEIEVDGEPLLIIREPDVLAIL